MYILVVLQQDKKVANSFLLLRQSILLHLLLHFRNTLHLLLSKLEVRKKVSSMRVENMLVVLAAQVVQDNLC